MTSVGTDVLEIGISSLFSILWEYVVAVSKH